MPLPPKPPPEELEPPLLLPPLDPELEPPLVFPPLDPELALVPALPRVPAETDPALRLAVEDELLGTEATLLPAELELTVLAIDADFAVAALTWAEAAAADLLVAATPPPLPDACPDTVDLAAWIAVLREAACWEATLDGLEPLGGGGAE